MTDKQEKNQIETQSDPLMDTQWLLGSGTPAEGSFALEDILAEFSPAEPGQSPQEPAPQEPQELPPAPPHRKKWWARRPAAAEPPPVPPPAEPAPEEAPAVSAGEPPEITEEMLDEAFFAGLPADGEAPSAPPV